MCLPSLLLIFVIYSVLQVCWFTGIHFSQPRQALVLCFCLFCWWRRGCKSSYSVVLFCLMGPCISPHFLILPFTTKLPKDIFLPLFISDCIPIKLYVQRQVSDCSWPVSWSLLTLRNCYVLMENWVLLPARSYPLETQYSREAKCRSKHHHS